VVFIAVQNLIGIGNVILKIVSMLCEFALKMPIRPFWVVFGAKNGECRNVFAVLSL